jgi:hypothetical protein
LLSLRTHAAIMASIFSAIIVLATVGNLLEASGVVMATPTLRIASMVLFFGLCIALMFSAVPVMVKLVLGAQVAIGNQGQPVVAAFLARERLIIFVMWALLALGLIVAVPAAIIDGAFD